jgi:hypothetical protein
VQQEGPDHDGKDRERESTPEDGRPGLAVPLFTGLFGKAQLGDVRPQHLLEDQVCSGISRRDRLLSAAFAGVDRSMNRYPRVGTV